MISRCARGSSILIICGNWEASLRNPILYFACFNRQGRSGLHDPSPSGSILPDDFLMKVDRASVAISLEIGTPFLDHRLVEYAFAKIPSIWKLRNRETRRVERILAKRLLPPQLDTKRKQGFSIPLDDWLKADNCQLLRHYMPYLPDCINRAEIERLIAGLFRGRANGARLYALLVLGIAMKNRYR